MNWEKFEHVGQTGRGGALEDCISYTSPGKIYIPIILLNQIDVSPKDYVQLFIDKDSGKVGIKKSSYEEIASLAVGAASKSSKAGVIHSRHLFSRGHIPKFRRYPAEVVDDMIVITINEETP